MIDSTIATLRQHLFKQLEVVSDTSKPLDMQRHKAICEVSQTIINSAKVEVEFAAIMKGSLEVPFIEAQAVERQSSNDPALPMHEQTPMERTASALAAGPSANHPWRAQIKK